MPHDTTTRGNTMSFLLDYNPGTQQWGYPRRGGARLSGTCIVHTAECAVDTVGADTAAEDCANFIANRADYGSYHRLVDSDSIIDMVPWEYEAWQDSETNNWAVGISAACRTTDWLTMPGNVRDAYYRNLAACAAEFVRYMAGKGVTVPLRRITGAEARARVPGFCAHGDSGIARTDPGVNFDWALFFAYTQAALDGSLSLQSQSITILEDELSAAEVERILADVATVHQTVIDGEARVKADIATVHNTMIYDVGGQLGALRSIVDQIATGQGVTIDYERVEAAAAAGAAAAMERGTVQVSYSVDGGKK